MAIVDLPIEEAWKAIWEIWSTERSLFVGIMLAVLLFVWFLIYSTNSNSASERQAFLSAMDKRDIQYLSSIEKLWDALNKNTEVMTELRSIIK
jgi:hypothetical protein